MVVSTYVALRTKVPGRWKCFYLTMQVSGRSFLLLVLYTLAWNYAPAQLDRIEQYKAVLDTAKSDLEKAKAYNEIAVSYYDLGDLTSSTKWLLKENNLYRSSGDTQSLILSLANLGTVYLAMEDNERTLQYMLEAIRIHAIRPAEFHPIYAFDMNIAAAYEGLGQLDSAELYYQRALSLREKSPSAPIFQALLLANYGNFLVSNGKLVGIRYDTQALAMLDSTPHDVNWHSAMSLIAEDYLTLGKTHEALGLLHLISTETEVDYFTTARLYSQAYEQLGDYEKALHYMKAYTAERDSTQLHQNDQVEALVVEYSTQLAKADSVKAQMKQDLDTSKSQQRTIVNAAALSIIVLLLAISSVLFFLYRKNQRYNIILSEKNRELHIERQQLEFKALLAQIKPHFLFNVLNSIQQFVAKKDIDSSFEYLGRFGSMMRSVLEHSDSTGVSLGSEVAALENYVQLEQLRLDHPLHFHVEFAQGLNPEEIDIPPMLLQPLVENAIWHGIQPRHAAGNIWLRVNQDDRAIFFEVEDNGIGCMEARQRAAEVKHVDEHISKGMEVTRQRIEALWTKTSGSGHLVMNDLQTTGGQGTIIRFSVPNPFAIS